MLRVNYGFNISSTYCKCNLIDIMTLYDVIMTSCLNILGDLMVCHSFLSKWIYSKQKLLK